MSAESLDAIPRSLCPFLIHRDLPQLAEHADPDCIQYVEAQTGGEADGPPEMQGDGENMATQSSGLATPGVLLARLISIQRLGLRRTTAVSQRRDLREIYTKLLDHP